MSRTSHPPRSVLRGPLPIAFAHKGGGEVWPENTLFAYRQSEALGFRHFDLDVHLTRDGVLVGCHDSTLERTTDGAGLIREHTLADLKRLDAGYRFSPDGGATYPFRAQGVEIPTLAEVLEALPDGRFTIEIKPNDPAAIGALLGVLDAHNGRDRVIVGSFQLAVLRELRRRSEGTVATSAGPAEVFRFWLAARARCQRFLSPDYDALQVTEKYGRIRILTPVFIAAAHGLGLQVHVWTVDDAADIRRILASGVDGIMSDRPDVLREVVKEVAGGVE